MQYRLRTLLILLAIGPPVLAGAWWASRQEGWGDYIQEMGIATLEFALLFAPLIIIGYIAARAKRR